MERNDIISSVTRSVLADFGFAEARPIGTMGKFAVAFACVESLLKECSNIDLKDDADYLEMIIQATPPLDISETDKHIMLLKLSKEAECLFPGICGADKLTCQISWPGGNDGGDDGIALRKGPKLNKVFVLEQLRRAICVILIQSKHPGTPLDSKHIQDAFPSFLEYNAISALSPAYAMEQLRNCCIEEFGCSPVSRKLRGHALVQFKRCYRFGLKWLLAAVPQLEQNTPEQSYATKVYASFEGIITNGSTVHLSSRINLLCELPTKWDDQSAREHIHDLLQHAWKVLQWNRDSSFQVLPLTSEEIERMKQCAACLVVPSALLSDEFLPAACFLAYFRELRKETHGNPSPPDESGFSSLNQDFFQEIELQCICLEIISLSQS